jgi:pimeloyl-ACP methyl ester carboxylesterase
VHEWPGGGGVVLHLPDPLTASSELAPSLDPEKRILSVQPRGDAPYQVHAADIREFIVQFGFERVEVVADGLGCVIALLVAAWCPTCIAHVRLVNPRFEAEGASLFARSLRECPPDWARIRAAIACPVD